MATLYLVEDHLVVRDGLRAMLETSNHVVIGETSDPERAMSDIQRLAPEVVLLDLNLGIRSGFEVLAEVQRRAMPVRCVVLTMHADARNVGEALRLGASAYVLKTAPVDELRAAIDAVTRGRRYLGTSVGGLAAEALAAKAVSESDIAGLSPRERQIVRMVVEGFSSAAIGEELSLAAKTVDTYRSRSMAKLGVRDVPSLVRLAIREGLIDP